jgi:hypothetical protein
MPYIIFTWHSLKQIKVVQILLENHWQEKISPIKTHLRWVNTLTRKVINLKIFIFSLGIDIASKNKNSAASQIEAK